MSDARRATALVMAGVIGGWMAVGVVIGVMGTLMVAGRLSGVGVLALVVVGSGFLWLAYKASGVLGFVAGEGADAVEREVEG